MVERKKWVSDPEVHHQRRQQAQQDQQKNKIVMFTNFIVGTDLDLISDQQLKYLDDIKTSRFLVMMDDLERECDRAARTPTSWDTVPAVICFSYTVLMGSKKIFNQRCIKMNLVGVAHKYIASIIKCMKEL